MPYAFAPADPTVTAALRRIAAEQIGRALETLGNDAQPLPGRIHAARKAVKKLRGLIRLVRPVFPDHRSETAALRQAGQAIAALRDAEVMLATLHRLAGEAGLDAAACAPLRAPFQRREDLAGSPAAMETALAAFRAGLSGMADRAPGWALKAEGFDALSPGLTRTWDAARAAMKAAHKHPVAEPMHDWRKRVKDHWYQARLLAPIWPQAMAPQVAAADQLGELLGEHHDLAVLSAEVAALPPSPAADAILRAAFARQKGIEAEAWPLGRRLLAGPAGATLARWEVWWGVWRAG